MLAVVVVKALSRGHLKKNRLANSKGQNEDFTKNGMTPNTKYNASILKIGTSAAVKIKIESANACHTTSGYFANLVFDEHTAENEHLILKVHRARVVDLRLYCFILKEFFSNLSLIVIGKRIEESNIACFINNCWLIFRRKCIQHKNRVITAIVTFTWTTRCAVGLTGTVLVVLVIISITF